MTPAKPLYKRAYAAWLRFGELLGRVNGAVLLTVVYYGLVTPLALLRRALGGGPFGGSSSDNTTFAPGTAARNRESFEKTW